MRYRFPDGSIQSTAATSSGVSNGDKGDITVSGGGTAWAIDAGSVSLAKMANVATGTLFYRKTAASGAPEVQSFATLKTDLGLTGTNSGDQTSIAGISGTLAQFNAAVTDADLLSVAGASAAYQPLDAAADRLCRAGLCQQCAQSCQGQCGGNRAGAGHDWRWRRFAGRRFGRAAIQ